MTLRSNESNSSALGYVIVVGAAAVLAFGLALVNFGLPQHHPTWFIALLLLGLLAGIGRPQAIGSIQISIYGIVQLAAIPLIGPVGTAIIAALSESFRRKEPVKRLFNMALRVHIALAAAFVYTRMGGRLLDYGTVDGSSLALQLSLAALAGAVVNSVLLAGVLKLTSGGSLRVFVADLAKQTVPTYGLYTIAAYMLVILWSPARLGWVSALFFLPSLFVIQWGLRQHAAVWATRQKVLTPFVRALDLRRPGATEQSLLGAEAAHAIAQGLGLSPTTVDDVSTAARLRDVGYLALDRAPEAIARRDHSLLARTVLGPVTFLDQSLAMIDAHHERIDGQGYPKGLTDRDIPIGAKIVAVADTWARLVASGIEADAAVNRCAMLAGTGLDQRCVEALRRAAERDQLPKVTT